MSNRSGVSFLAKSRSSSRLQSAIKVYDTIEYPRLLANVVFSPFATSTTMELPHLPPPSERGSTASAASSTVTKSAAVPEEHQEALEMLLAMGFERSQAEKALRASFYDLERAVEYLASVMHAQRPTSSCFHRCVLF